MMRSSVFIPMFLLSAVMFSCGTKKNAAVSDTSKTSLDWNGIYLYSDNNYKLPDIQLTLNPDGTYKLVAAAFGDESKNTYMKGTFEWDQQGRIIRLDNQIPHLNTNRLVVGENTLFILTSESADNRSLTGLEQFHKVQTDSNLVEKYWKLVSINDRIVTKDDFMSREPHLIFKSEFSRINGNDGCNGFGGMYQLNGTTISFDKLISTMMACPDSFVFEQFTKILQGDLTYQATEETLVIQSKKDVLKFEVVYLR